MLVHLQVIGQIVDLLGQQSDLHFGRSGVLVVDAELCDDFGFLFFGQCHFLSSCLILNFFLAERRSVAEPRRSRSNTISSILFRFKKNLRSRKVHGIFFHAVSFLLPAKYSRVSVSSHSSCFFRSERLSNFISSRILR